MVHTVEFVDVMLYVHASTHGILTVSRSSLPSARQERIPAEECIVRMMSAHEGAKAVIRLPKYLAAAKKLLPPTQFEVDQMVARKQAAMDKSAAESPVRNTPTASASTKASPLTGRAIIERNKPVSDAERIKLMLTDLEDYAPGEFGDEYQAGTV